MKEQKQANQQNVGAVTHTHTHTHNTFYRIGGQFGERELYFREKDGITLVTLVVTIVVLLILSGVTISTLLGDNGIITKANEAAELTKRSTVVSSVQLDILMEEMEGEITQEKLERILNKYGTTEKNDPENPDNVTGLKVEGVKDSIPIEELYAETLAGGDNPQKPQEPEVPKGPNGNPLLSTITDTNHENLTVEDKYGNVVTVPEGFKVVAGKAGEEISVQNGVVIEDSAGNQFVWIPVGIVNKNDGTKSNEIVLGRYKFARTKNADTGLYEDGTPTLVQNANEYAKTTANIVKNSESTVSKYKIGSYHYELSDQREGLIDESNRLNDLNATAKNLAEFVQSVKNNGGYYLARYEASYGSGYNADGTTDTEKYGNAKPLSKPSTAFNKDSMNYTSGALWNFIIQLNASKVAKNMYAGNKDINNNKVGVESDLVNSYAWDTAIVYIQEMGNANYANAFCDTIGSTSLMDTGATGDVRCNIYDMAGNEAEWTTEYSTHTYSSSASPCVPRGGHCANRNTYTALRGHSDATGSNYNISFRLTLYIK